MISIVTPSYNRAHLLKRLFDSLCQQTDKDFEWIFVDDGSTDNTDEIIHNLINTNLSLISFPFQYIKKENGGKHTALNRGIKEAKGELILILDSDDSLPPTALETIKKYFEPIKDDFSFGGVAGYMAHHDGTVIGHGFHFDTFDASPKDIQHKYKLNGDMAEVFKTSVLKEFPFPEIEGEKFCPEDLVWNRISKKYKLRYFNKVIYYRDYLDDGLTSKIIRIRMDSPIASTICYSELASSNVPLKIKIKSAINFWRFRFCKSKHSFPHIPFYWLWTMPIGWAMHLNDIRKCQ